MSGINAQEFIDELIFCIKEEDVVKAKALLQFSSDAEVDADVQRKALIELAKGPEKVVFPLLEYLTKVDISNPKIQESIYDLILDKAYGNTDLVIKYITENEKKARLLFLKASGDLLLEQTAPVLQKIIKEDKDKDILVAAINALGALRLPDSLALFASMASREEQVNRAAIFAIAEQGGNDAVDQLLKFIGEDEQTNKIAVEALGEMQDLYSLEKLTALLGSKITIVRDTAIDQLMRLGNKSTPILTNAFQNADADYLVHLVTTLGYIGDPASINPILDIINTQPADANIRQAAYEAMERIPSPKTAISLVQGLQDPVESVRMSAARAIDKNLSKALVAGLRNVVREGSAESQKAVAALIDSDASNIFNFLVEEESFMVLAQTHVNTKADPATRKEFIKQMSSIGQKEFAQTIAKEMPKAEAPAARTTQIFVVDDSKMMLKLYQNKLTALGFTPVTFDKPENAIPQIITKKPDLVITDLNMPNISGLELTREIRKKYTRQDIPILMITTQSDFVEEKDGDIKINDSVLTKSGINKILHKPFTDEEFHKAVGQFIKT
ncbi:MAG: HEAT repeat domain-containing protein [Proteobacteria bacterium]|nr:HEAT repeat domain-containing protein [Pseudomonadota bacterium]MBU1387912.1 HEAT repeat domain-containing protein [Pseudomonadota bacterium]MBU1541975.1 HEAT repeat domain-containing protein [Pseudomonadota bacterium]MBU2481339.1 HEAT repeat domain-containing protein [Pseudomonadota bacterium]